MMVYLTNLKESLDLEVLEPVGGGSINDAYRGRRQDGVFLFVKTHPAPPDGFFKAEAAGLNALADAGATVPRVITQASDHLVLEWIDTAPPGRNSMVQLGEALARVHGTVGPHFGYSELTYCGLSPQSNQASTDGHAFFAEHRLLRQGAWAFDAGHLTRPHMRQLERLCDRLPELIPVQPPSLIHGDLWSGNVLFDAGCQPLLIDPAVSWSWAEADLAMTRLFGGFDERFHEVYQAHRPLEPGFEQRVPIYNLYHLLNHLNLFGGGYRSSVLSVLKGF